MKTAIQCIVLLIICGLSSACTSSPSNKSSQQLTGSSVKERSSIENTNVIFTNISSFARPGFIRMPLSHRMEMDLFITNSPPFHSVHLDESFEFFYSGDSHIPYIISSNDTILIKSDSTRISSLYRLTSTNPVSSARIEAFQEAIRNKIPLYYTEIDNQRAGLINKSEILNKPEMIISLYRTASQFMDTFNVKMDKGLGQLVCAM